MHACRSTLEDPTSGPFDESGDATQCVLATAADLLADARAAGVEPSELHVDFDCATSRLDGFRRWIVALRAAAAPTPVTFTALPAWLRSDAFPRLARAADGYVLQVHSLERPAAPDEIGVFCDPVRARRWVERAARIGVPFRVALPTYGYDAAFDAGGRFLGLEAETAARAWPAGTRRVGVAADPAAMASLVRAWTEDRPRELAGLIWYRLPAPDDRRNWTADALRRVRRGEVPTADVRVTVERPEPGLAQIRVENRGPLPGRSPAAFSVRWSGARLVASDGLGGFALGADGPGRVAARREEGATVAANSSRVVAWLRFDGAAEEVAVDASR